MLWVGPKLFGIFEWGIMGGGDNCWDFHKINCERGVIYNCLGYFVGVANLFNPHVAIGGGK
jgi:hypothetical protein